MRDEYNLHPGWAILSLVPKYGIKPILEDNNGFYIFTIQPVLDFKNQSS